MKQQITYTELQNLCNRYRLTSFLKSVMNTEFVTVDEILDSDKLTVKEKRFIVMEMFLENSQERINFGYDILKVTFPLHELSYKGNKIINGCWKAIENYNDGKIKIGTLNHHKLKIDKLLKEISDDDRTRENMISRSIILALYYLCDAYHEFYNDVDNTYPRVVSILMLDCTDNAIPTSCNIEYLEKVMEFMKEFFS